MKSEVKADRYGHYVDDISVPAHNALRLIKKTRSMINQIQKASLQLFSKEHQLGPQAFDYSGNTSSTASAEPILEKKHNVFTWIKSLLPERKLRDVI